MSRSFIALYLDEDVDVLVAGLVRARGYVATTTHDAGHVGASDAEQLEYAVRHENTLFTHNRVDFEKLAREYFETERRHFGIIIAVRRPPHQLARHLLRILSEVTGDEMENQIRYI